MKYTKTAALIFAATMANAQKINEPPISVKQKICITYLSISDSKNTHHFFVTEKDEHTGVVLRFAPYEISPGGFTSTTCLPPCLPCATFKPTIIDYKGNAEKS